MNEETRPTRPSTLALTMIVAFLAALAALAVSTGNDAQAYGHAPDRAGAPSAVSHASTAGTGKEAALRSDLRVLWEDHITWTRLAIISLTTGSPDTKATVARLLKNQADLGNAVKPFYGNAAGNALTAKLRRHILIAADVVAAAKAGDQAGLADAQARWQQNANEIAGVLNSVNPRFWKLGAMKAELSKHLTLTTQEAVARLQGNWAGDVVAYDRIHRHILHLSDLLADGLIKQFPQRFR